MDKKYDPKNLFLKGQRFIKSKKEDKEKTKLHPEKFQFNIEKTKNR